MTGSGRSAYRSGVSEHPVVRRADGSFLYMLPSVVDDIDMAVTHVVRVKTMSRTRACRYSVRWALSRSLPICRCSWARKAASCRSAQAIYQPATCAVRVSNRSPPWRCSRGSAISQPVEPQTTAVPLIETFDFAAFGVRRAST